MKRPRYQRKAQILKMLLLLNFHNGLTMARIAFWIQMSPSSHLMGILREMREGGLLSSKPLPHRPGMNKIMWSPTHRGRQLARAALKREQQW